MATAAVPSTPTAEGHAAKRVRRQQSAIRAAAASGAVLAVVGVVIGISMAVHRIVVDCPNGHYFPQGTTDFRCFSHPHAGEGVAIAIVAIMLGIGLALLSFLALALTDAATTASPGEAPPQNG